MTRFANIWSATCLLTLTGALAMGALGCGDDDGAAGAAAVGGSAGESGSGGSGGDAGTGGGAGVGDTDAGDHDSGMSGGTGGVGGTGGSAGTAGTGGTGGGSACATDCDDNIDCTVDTCVAGGCVHVVDASACSNGQSCHPMRGCETGSTCGVPADCADTDGCTVMERCDTPSGTCRWLPLDNDGDGQSPRACGGGDCDDSDQAVFPGAVDACNGSDDDCDEAIDEDAACENGRSCVGGACICPAGKNICSGQCVDRNTSKDHCGACGNSCGEAGICNNGSCTCSSPGAICGSGINRTCVNTGTSHSNCGGCGITCEDLEYCNRGSCEPCGAMGQACCGPSSDTFNDNDGCPGSDLLCIGMRGRPLSRCDCPNDFELCDGDCIDPKTNNDHCGTCGEGCSGGLLGAASETCINGACETCGQEVGDPCCAVGTPFGGDMMLSCNNALFPLLRCNQDTGLCRLGLF